MKFKTISTIGGVLIIFAGGVFAGYNFASNKVQFALFQPAESNTSESRSGEENLINPLLDCDIGDELLRTELKPFKDEVQAYIDKKTKEGVITESAMYFRDLNNGPNFGINIDFSFIPASLLKVPIMIAYFKEAESQPQTLEKMLEFKPEMADPNYVQTLVPESQRLEVGKKYSVKDLVSKMIANSDNNAKTVLVANLEPSLILKTYNDLGLSVKNLDNIDQNVTIKQYATFFRILFNASYLTKDFSQLALQYLAQASFQKGLAKNLPSDIKIAHKYGVPQTTDGLKELHNCGIIYYPKRPYLLCVMTKGDDYTELENFISNISDIAYRNVDKQIQLKGN